MKKSWVFSWNSCWFGPFFNCPLICFCALWGMHIYLETSIGLTKLRRCWFFSVVDISSLEGSCSLRKQFEIQVLGSFPRRGMVRINSSFLMLPVRFLRQGVADLVVIGESSALTRNQFWRWSHYLNKLSLNHPLGCYIWRNDGQTRIQWPIIGATMMLYDHHDQSWILPGRYFWTPAAWMIFSQFMCIHWI